MRRLWAVSHHASHEDVFVERYQRLLEQALHITGQSRTAAEDLVHDAFIQFTLRVPDLGAIRDLDSYLFIVLRNLHLSQVRRASQAQFTTVSIADYDSAEIGLRAIDVQSHLQVAEELRQICCYACLRKESSKAGSVLILRFFHGYYTTEIAGMIRAPRKTVYEWLQIARRETRMFLEDPQSLKFIKTDATKSAERRHHPVPASQDLLLEMRESIFESRRGKCHSSAQLQSLYETGNDLTIDGRILAHIVSCPHCLEEVNKLQGLPPFSNRYPTDSLGPDMRTRREGKEMKTTTLDENQDIKLMKTYRRRLGQLMDHQPQALSFAANGFILGSQKVRSDLTEQVLSLNIDEEISFVEVFSEQGIRLMLMDVLPPASGGVQQKARLQYEEGRELECALTFDSPWPTLHVTYLDPSFKADTVSTVQEAEPYGHELNSLPTVWNESQEPERRPRFFDQIKQRLGPLFDARMWFRPVTITALFALMLIASLALWYWRTSKSAPVFAADLLARAATAEEMATAQKDTVVHRTISFDEKTGTGATMTRSRIEIWQSAERGITARRLYDDRGNLIAGYWRRADGVQTIYHHGSQPKLQLNPDQREITMGFENVWQLTPSAKEFSILIPDISQLHVEDGQTTYVINYERGPNSTNQEIVRASLTLTRSDLHPVEETLLIQQGTELRLFSFAESSFEQHRPATVAPGVFEPDAVIISERMNDEGGRMNEATSPLALGSSPASSSPVIATPELEIEVLRLLSSVGADTGEQVSVKRTPSGLLQVDAIVDSEQRKREILNALAQVRDNPALRTDVQTVDERLAREARARPSTGAMTVERIEPTTNSIPLDAELRRYFTAKGVAPNQIDDEIRRFCRTALGHSSQVLQHAGALKNLAGRFSAEDLRTLDPQSKSKWLELIHNHAQAVRQNVIALQRELSAALASPAVDSIKESDAAGDAEIVQSVDRLFALCSASDSSVRGALSLSNDASRRTAVKGTQFQRALADIQRLATRLAQAN
jgi:RNA polymerase sigma factor (sigma-70 family)